MAPIHVSPRGGPIVLYERDHGSHVVKLESSGTYWAQQAYQFSHEFCHIVSGYRDGGDRNKWFEEALCETASLYSLRRMADHWETEPPYPNWKDYAGSLRSYAREIIEGTETPRDMAAWWRENRAVLENKADDRPRNRVVAVRLLPVFEKTPELWGAVPCVNRGAERDRQDFPAFLQNWYEQAPRRMGPAIAGIARMFGVAVKPEPETP